MSRRRTPPGGDEQEGSFLRRWSDRKLSNRSLHDETRDVNGPSAASEKAAGEPVVDPDADANQRVLTDEDMPDLDSLNEDSSVADFLSSGVSETLRRMALRKVFHGAAFNVRDGLDDYDLDYTKFEKLGDVVTADMRHRLQMEAERLSKMDTESGSEETDQKGEPRSDEVVHKEDDDEPDAPQADEETNESVTSRGKTPDERQTPDGKPS